MRSCVFLGLALLLVGCILGQEVNLDHKDVHFTASIERYGKKLDPNTLMVKGSLTISNKSNDDIDYSNKDLFLVVENEGESRTWLNSLSSHYIDIDTVKIEAGESKEYQVYWALPPVKSISAESIHLEWRQP